MSNFVKGSGLGKSSQASLYNTVNSSALMLLTGGLVLRRPDSHFVQC